jgi:predicted transcriptional regulator
MKDNISDAKGRVNVRRYKGSATRKKILEFVIAHAKEGCTIYDMKKRLNLSEGNIYHHLKVLEHENKIKIENKVERGRLKKLVFPKELSLPKRKPLEMLDFSQHKRKLLSFLEKLRKNY